MNTKTTNPTPELNKLAALARTPKAFAPDLPDIPTPENPGEWDPTQWASYKAYGKAFNEYALLCWLRTLPPKERAASWRYISAMRAWQNDENASLDAIPTLEEYGMYKFGY